MRLFIHTSFQYLLFSLLYMYHKASRDDNRLRPGRVWIEACSDFSVSIKQYESGQFFKLNDRL